MLPRLPGQFVTLLLLLLSVSGCNHNEGAGKSAKQETDAGKPDATSVETHTVQGIAHVEQFELPGASVRGFETTELFAKVGGYVKEIGSIGQAGETEKAEEIDIGMIVEKDSVLAVLNIPEMEEELNEKRALVEKANSIVSQAAAAVRQAQAGLTKGKAGIEEAKALKHEKQALLELQQSKRANIIRLVEDGAVGTERRDEAEFAFKAAEAALKSVDAKVETAHANLLVAQANLAKAEADKQSALADVKVAQASVARLKTMAQYATISAPFKGVITKRMVDRGAFVRPATSNSGAMPLFEITRVDKVRIVAAVPNVQADRILVGQKVLFHDIGGLPGASVAGTVTRSGVALDRKSRMMQIEVHVENPHKHPSTNKTFYLQPGMFGTVRAIVQDWTDLPVVPASAVATDATGQHYVMVVESSNICRRRPVEIAFNNAENVGIRNGVKIGEPVVLKEVGKLKDGQTISPKSQ